MGQTKSIAVVVGGRIRAVRKARGFTLDKVGRKVGATKGMISKIELGRPMVTLEQYAALAAALGLSLEELLHGLPASKIGSLGKVRKIGPKRAA